MQKRLERFAASQSQRPAEGANLHKRNSSENCTKVKRQSPAPTERVKENGLSSPENVCDSDTKVTKSPSSQQCNSPGSKIYSSAAKT